MLFTSNVAEVSINARENWDFEGMYKCSDAIFNYVRRVYYCGWQCSVNKVSIPAVPILPIIKAKNSPPHWLYGRIRLQKCNLEHTFSKV